MAEKVVGGMKTTSTGFYIARITAGGKSLFYTGRDREGVAKMWSRQTPLEVVWLADCPAKFMTEQEALVHARLLHLDLPAGDRLMVFQLGIGNLTMLSMPSIRTLEEHRKELASKRRAARRIMRRKRGA